MSKDKRNMLDIEIEEEMKELSDEALHITYLTKDNTTFTKTKGGFISLKMEDKEYTRVDFYRTFPLSDPDIYISVREADEKKREIGMIKNLKEDYLPETVEMINEQLEIRYFTPEIIRVYDVKNEYGYAYFHVLTNFGECKFTTFLNGGAVNLSETRIMFSDIDGNRYDIPDLGKMTTKELKKLDLFL